MARSDVGMTLGDMAPGKTVVVLIPMLLPPRAEAWQTTINEDGSVGPVFQRDMKADPELPSDVMWGVEQQIFDHFEVKYDPAEDVLYADLPLMWRHVESST
jgi:hypothetical protein